MTQSAWTRHRPLVYYWHRFQAKTRLGKLAAAALLCNACNTALQLSMLHKGHSHLLLACLFGFVTLSNLLTIWPQRHDGYVKGEFSGDLTSRDPYYFTTKSRLATFLPGDWDALAAEDWVALLSLRGETRGGYQVPAFETAGIARQNFTEARLFALGKLGAAKLLAHCPDPELRLKLIGQLTHTSSQPV